MNPEDEPPAAGAGEAAAGEAAGGSAAGGALVAMAGSADVEDSIIDLEVLELSAGTVRVEVVPPARGDVPDEIAAG